MYILWIPVAIASGLASYILCRNCSCVPYFHNNIRRYLVQHNVNTLHTSYITLSSTCTKA